LRKKKSMTEKQTMALNWELFSHNSSRAAQYTQVPSLILLAIINRCFFWKLVS